MGNIIGIGSGPTTDPATGNDVYQMVCAETTSFAPHGPDASGVTGTVEGAPGFTPAPNYTPCAEHAAIDAYCGCTPTSLANAQTVTRANIDAKSDALIAGGFVYSGLTFSLSNDAQLKWLGLAIGAASLTYPYPVPNIDDTASFSIPDA